MRFASGLAALLLLTGAPARANDDTPAEQAGPDTPDAGATPRDQLGEELSAQLQTIDHTLGSVNEKLTAADVQRLRRMRAAYRVLQQPVGDDPMAAARRRAAVRLLARRDSAERALLAGEAAHLHGAQIVKIEATTKVPELALPDEVQRPVRGDITRHFGTYQHERSKAILSRRGIDFDVALHAEALAPADGVVRYAGTIRGLEHGVILDHGDYLSVIAKLDHVCLEVGAHVARGERIGRAAKHRVYFELRAKVTPGGLPFDPEPLLRSASR